MSKKLLCLMSLLVAGLPPMAAANDIEPGKEFYTAPFTPNPIVLDGKLDEWGGVALLADPKFAIPKGSGANGTYVLFEEYAGGTWSGPADQTSAVQVVYDADNVYFGFIVTDDYHENGAGSAWNGDSVQLMIANAGRNQQIALYNYALGGIEGELGEVIVMHEAGPGGTEAVVTRDGAAKKTYYEIKLPASALGITPPLRAGMQFGLGMAINDGDDGPGQQGQKGWGGLGAHAIVFGKTPSETALVTLGAAETTIEILGVGAESLLGGDLTDPENDGLDALGAKNDPSWNWADITSSHEPDFEGGEFAFNIFDNKVGGGNDKWCCDDPTPGNPVWVAVQFRNPVSLTHFTVTSGNDTPTRDPTDWAIQGSNDGVSYTDIFRATPTSHPVVPWTERNQVVKFTLPTPSPAYRYVRYIAYDTPAPLHQLNEIEYFGTFGGSAVAFLSGVRNTITTFGFRLNDTATSIVNPASVTLTLDGETIPLGTLTKVDGAIDVNYTAPRPFLPGSTHTFSIRAQDGSGNTVASTGEFTTQAYALLTPDLKRTPDTSKPGFIWEIHANAGFQANNNTRPLQQLAGELGPNWADPANQGFDGTSGALLALAPGTPAANVGNNPVRFEIPTVINMSQDGFDNNGEFGPDNSMPGIPGLNLETGDSVVDGLAARITTYIELPAGLTQMIVNSDDGFRTTAGIPADAFLAQRAGEFNGGRGATDTVFTVFAEEPGVYAFVTVWQEGGGGANIEWKTIKADGTRALINDVANGGLRAYRALTTPDNPTIIRSVSPAPGATTVSPSAAIEAVIFEGATPVDLATVRLTLNGNPVTATPTRNGSVITIRHQPSALFAPSSSHTATVSYNTRTESWSFSVPAYVTDTVAKYPALHVGNPRQTADRGGASGAAGDYGYDLPVAGAALQVVDSAFMTALNAATGADELSVSMWIRKYDIAASSAFWFASPSQGRVYQAHTPWSDNNIYFDTGGCCDGVNQRISANIDTFPGFTGDTTDTSWWQNWRLYTFSKKADVKQIYIDGVLFLEGSSLNPLSTDINILAIGSEPSGANRMHAVIDDFAVYGKALTPADITALKNGTKPSALTSAGLLAYWDFNALPTVEPPPPPPGIPVAAATSVGAALTTTGDGLFGEYWQRGVNTIKTDGNTVAANRVDVQIASFGPPTGRFQATRFSYTGNDLTAMPAWLATDAASYVGAPGNLDDGAFRFTGFLNIAAPGTFKIGTVSDDGSRIKIGGVDIINNDGGHGDQTVDADVSFTAAGLYPIEITYFNGDWTSDNSPDGSPAGVNHSGNPDPSVHGGANFHLRVNGATITAAQVEQYLFSVPGPSYVKPTTIAGAALSIDGGGLNGEYWQRGVNTIRTDGNTVPANRIDTQILGFGRPTGTFTATRFSYTGNDLTAMPGWLATDAASYAGTPGNLDDGAFRFRGFLNVKAPGSLQIGTTSDDGSRIKIGGQDVINNDGGHGDATVDATVNFVAAGLYPIEITYFNGDWTSDNSPDGSPAGVNHSGNPDPSVHGGANFHLRMSGATITAEGVKLLHRTKDGSTPVADTIAINFAADEQAPAGSAVTGAAGALGTVNWNNVNGANGTAANLVADGDGAAFTTTASVQWTSPNTWRTGTGQNSAPVGNDRNLMTGYLDSNNTTGPSITVSGVPFSNYDVYVYILGDNITAGRGGDYKIGDKTAQHIMSAAFTGTYREGTGGHYVVLRGISGPGFTLTSTPLFPTGGTLRAPICAIEIVQAASQNIVIDSITLAGDSVALTWTGGTGPFLVQGAPSITGPWIDLVTTSERRTTQFNFGTSAFFRVAGGTTKNVRQFKAVLTGAAERPTPVVTNARGVASVSVDGTTVITILAYSGLSGPPTAGHFHGPATAEQAVSVLVGFPNGALPAATSGAAIIPLAFTAAQVDSLVNGLTYINIHTAANGGGEIRGQVLP